MEFSIKFGSRSQDERLREKCINYALKVGVIYQQHEGGIVVTTEITKCAKEIFDFIKTGEVCNKKPVEGTDNTNKL
jgi:hypothetical protein